MSNSIKGLNKKQIRQTLLKKRNGLDRSDVIEASQGILEKIIVAEEFELCKQLFLYAPLGNEIDMSKLFYFAKENGKAIGFPKVMSKEEILFYRVQELNELEAGKFGLLEPNSQWVMECSKLTLMIIPGIAFDLQGYRIGFGAGYYDRYLSKNSPLATFGVAYSWQVFDQIPKEEYDLALTRIITEK